MLRTLQGNAILLIASVGVLYTGYTHGMLLFPTSTVLQLTSTLSIPIELADPRKLFMDIGFQMNYNLPFNLVSFYNSTIWADELARGKRDVTNGTAKYGLYREQSSGVHANDFTACELYSSLEGMLQQNGYHKSCLLRSVCELALHPFDEDHSYTYSLIVKLLTFVLTPSQHEGFAETEEICRDRYERAELLGFAGGNCKSAFPKCKMDLLNVITRLVI